MVKAQEKAQLHTRCAHNVDTSKTNLTTNGVFGAEFRLSLLHAHNSLLEIMPMIHVYIINKLKVNNMSGLKYLPFHKPLLFLTITAFLQDLTPGILCHSRIKCLMVATDKSNNVLVDPRST